MKKLEREGVLNRELEALPTIAAGTAPARAGRRAHRARAGGADGVDQDRAGRRAARLRPARRPLPRRRPARPTSRSRCRTASLEQIREHPLRREIIVTQVVNDLVNGAGMTFWPRLAGETGATAAELTRANFVAREIFGSLPLREELKGWDNKLDAQVQTRMRIQMRTLVERASRWLVTNRRPPLDSQGTVDHFRGAGAGADGAAARADDRPRARATCSRAATRSWSRACPRTSPPGWRCSTRRTRCSGIVETALRDDLDPAEVARVHFALGERLGLPTLVQRIFALPREDRWQTMARAALRDDLYAVHSQLTAQVLAATAGDDPAPARIATWEESDEVAVGRASGDARGDLRRRRRRPGPDVGRAAGGPRAALDRMNRPDGADPAGVAETARAVVAGETTARAETEAALARIADADRRLNAFSVVLADQALAEADRPRRRAGRGRAARGRSTACRSRSRRRSTSPGTVTTFGGRGNSTPGHRRRRGGPPAARGRRRRRRQDHDAGVRRLPLHRVRRARHHPQPVGPRPARPAAPAEVRRPRWPRAWCRRASGGDGGGSIRIPSACCGLFGLKPQRGRVTTAPQPHLWWALGTAGPLTRSVLDSALVYDVIRGNVDERPLPGRDRPGRSSPPPPASPDGCGSAGRTQAGRPRRTTRPRCTCAAVQDTARLLADLGHDVREVDPRYPDPTAAFVPQFFAGIRTEADQVEHYDRLEPRTRQSCRMGAWVTPRVRDAALRADRAGLGEGQPGLRRRRRAADADDGPPSPRDRRASPAPAP